MEGREGDEERNKMGQRNMFSRCSRYRICGHSWYGHQISEKRVSANWHFPFLFPASLSPLILPSSHPLSQREPAFFFYPFELKITLHANRIGRIVESGGWLFSLINQIDRTNGMSTNKRKKILFRSRIVFSPLSLSSHGWNRNKLSRPLIHSPFSSIRRRTPPPVILG